MMYQIMSIGKKKKKLHRRGEGEAKFNIIYKNTCLFESVKNFHLFKILYTHRVTSVSITGTSAKIKFKK